MPACHIFQMVVVQMLSLSRNNQEKCKLGQVNWGSRVSGGTLVHWSMLQVAKTRKSTIYLVVCQQAARRRVLCLFLSITSHPSMQDPRQPTSTSVVADSPSMLPTTKMPKQPKKLLQRRNWLLRIHNRDSLTSRSLKASTCLQELQQNNLG